jgi:MHS family shikimate/dehydroshikimate transporter-like MFS transporter
MYGPQGAYYAELFGTRVRYSGASLGYQLASVFAGGLRRSLRPRCSPQAGSVRGSSRCTWPGWR